VGFLLCFLKFTDPSAASQNNGEILLVQKAFVSQFSGLEDKFGMAGIVIKKPFPD